MSGIISATTPDEISIYRAITIKHGLKLLRSGMKPSRNWTAKAVFKTASSITGKTYKRGEYEAAIADLDVWIETKKKERGAQ